MLGGRKRKPSQVVTQLRFFNGWLNSEQSIRRWQTVSPWGKLRGPKINRFVCLTFNSCCQVVSIPCSSSCPAGYLWSIVPLKEFHGFCQLSFQPIITYVPLCNSTFTSEVSLRLSPVDFSWTSVSFAFLTPLSGICWPFCWLLFRSFVCAFHFVCIPFSGSTLSLTRAQVEAIICRVFTVTKAKRCRGMCWPEAGQAKSSQAGVLFCFCFALTTFPRTVHNVNVMSTFHQFILPFRVAFVIRWAGNS